MRELFFLDPEIHYLDHGSFGAVPRPVFDVFMDWQRRLERHPVKFFTRELREHLAGARNALGELVGASGDDLAFVPNATYAVNLVAGSLPLQAGDEVLTSTHEYGACDKAWQRQADKRGFHMVRRPVPLALSPEDQLECLWRGVTPATKAVFVSHITSTTAQRFPVKMLCRRAREAGLLSVIDGAHAVGQIPLNLHDLAPDFYTSNGHKWLLSPKTSAFLYVRPAVQALVEPLVASWGWGGDTPLPFGSPFLDNLQWPGTANVAAYLAVPAAIAFQAEHRWPRVREGCHALLAGTLERITKGTGMPFPYLSSSDFARMGIAPIPRVDSKRLHDLLLQEHRVEVPITLWDGNCFVRVSVQGYNTEADLEALERGLEDCLSRA